MFDQLLRQPGVVETVELRSTFGFMAFHGGLEGGTETIAAEAALRADASVYTVVQPPDLIWHVPSALVSPEHSPELARFLRHVDVVVAVHGYGRPGRSDDVLVGGSNRHLAAHLAARLRVEADGLTVIDDVDAIPAELRGLHPDNPVNRPRAGGVQLELPPRARGASPSPRDRGMLCIPLLGVVEALAVAASTWDG
ncbi:MAG TPA: poly-gamma-glutamate hydrolase family protein [Acidimicrobiales bacterium]|nr:poly-gamma-glutamate hydrolase family protein [Acidimicrobiales bacterium]